MLEQKSPHMILVFFLAMFLLSIGVLAWLLRPFASILILAFVVTGVFSPLYGLLSKKIKPAAASGITCIIIFITLFLPIVLFAGILASEAVGLLNSAKHAQLPDQIMTFLSNSQLIERTNNFFSGYGVKFTSAELTKAASEVGQFVGGFLLDQTRAVATNIMRFLANFFFMLLVIYFFLMDGQKLVDYLVDLSPLPKEQDEKVVIKFREMSGAILLGNGLCGLVQGVIGGVLFAVFGLASPFLWGVVMGLLAFLPIVGIGVVMLPAAIILILKGRVALGIFFIIFYSVTSFSVEYVIKPKLVGDRVKMHPLLVFLAIVGGLKLFGLLGIIYGPLIVTFFLTLSDIYHTSYQQIVESRPKSVQSPEPG